MSFTGAKLALFLGQKLVVILRDDKPDIPFPAFWDLPGGGREGDESAKACALRETHEEIGLELEELDIVWAREYRGEAETSWFFAAHLPEDEISKIQLGDEGQRWEMMTPEDYCAHPKAVPNFKLRLQEYLDAKSVEIWD
ncbi:NUDIX hydrolase [Epibacterium ulvae]|uniref:NUDIX hydrolase n=1 Tax=Epibacterium ulvae TaxID=1156985 RepID=UPI001BFBF817|nr:NUDIX hydrolase [Epibacterium ulvae]MBT8155058.1 NUDIX hydrolase [Epibacterium ulvae]